MPENVSYTTIEVVSQAHPELLRYTTPEVRAKKAHTPVDIVDKMSEFEQVSMMLYSENKLSKKDIDNKYCPAYHCIDNFLHPRLKPYLSLFNQGVVTNKALILKNIKR